MGVFRPSLDIGTGETPDRKKEKDASNEGKDDIKDLKALKRRTEKRVVRARSRVEDIENELLLSDDPDDIEDLKYDLEEAKKKKKAAMMEWKTATKDLSNAEIKVKRKAVAKEEARIEKMDFAQKRKRSKARVKVGMGDALPEIDEPLPPEDEAPFPEIESEEEEEAFDTEVIEAALSGSHKEKRSKWTPKKAIAVGVILFLILPILLYGFVIPRVDITVKTWYSEGFQNSIVVDSKIKNDGTVEIKNLDINVTLIKEIDGIEVLMTGMSFDDPLIYPHSEQKFDSFSIRDDQNAKYILIVSFSCNAGNKYVDKSYTHYIDEPYMSFFFEDKVFMWGL